MLKGKEKSSIVSTYFKKEGGRREGTMPCGNDRNKKEKRKWSKDTHTGLYHLREFV
jgi:hypothetical protein